MSGKVFNDKKVKKSESPGYYNTTERYMKYAVVTDSTTGIEYKSKLDDNEGNPLPTVNAMGAENTWWDEYKPGGDGTALIRNIKLVDHGFVKWDAVKVINKGYDKALADDPENADTYGIISKVKDKDHFVLTLNGFIEDPDSDLPEDSDFYLSNKIAGEISPGEYLIIEFGEIIQYIGTTVSIDTADGNVKGLNVQISEGIQAY